MTVPVFYADECLAHDGGDGHPERAERLSAIVDRLRSAPYRNALAWPEFPQATSDQLLRVHTQDHLNRVAESALHPVTQFDADTQGNDRSHDAALWASGAAVAAVDAVMRGPGRPFVATRPPGHHATPDRAMGFCFYNHVAVAAAHAIAVHGLSRVAIVDWDVHHGNGTEYAFYHRRDIYYFSIHQFPHYPGTGRAQDTGNGDGNGYTLNLPLPAGSSGEDYLTCMDNEVLPALLQYQPELILVSAGFDAHQRDPLSGMLLTGRDYHGMTDRLVNAAEETCAGRIVHLLEGGYDLQGLVDGIDGMMTRLTQAPDDPV